MRFSYAASVPILCPLFVQDSDAAPSRGVWEVNRRELCEGKEVRYNECHNDPCGGVCIPRNCYFRPWSEWSAGFCTGLCERERGIATTCNECGSPCHGSISETKACRPVCHSRAHQCGPEDVDCAWESWSQWTACTSSCGGGQRTRSRDVAVHQFGFGKPCVALTKSEATACNTQPCSWQMPCIDGEWAAWSSWGLCSASCGGGLFWRSREIARQPNDCGQMPRGDDKDVRLCNSVPCTPGKVDCSFGQWSAWSDCSCSCSGVKRRTRVIDAFAKDMGKACQGPTKEVAPCNLYTNTPGCHSLYERVDCAISCWGDWGNCIGTDSCSSGQRIRERRVAVEAKHGGKVCEAGLTVMEPCHQDGCRESRPPTPCTWGQWSPWSPCDRCGGTRKRARRIDQLPKDGGAPCQPQAAEEVARCPGPTNCQRRIFCAWGEWADMGECSATCGTGTVRRVRYLEADVQVTNITEDAFISKVGIGRPAASNLQMQPALPEPSNRHLLLLPGLLGGCLTTLMAQWIFRRAARGPEGADKHLRWWRMPASGSDPEHPGL